MATYRLKRKYFGTTMPGGGFSFKSQSLGGKTLELAGGGSKGWGAFGLGMLGVTAIQGKKQRAATAEQNNQALQEQKDKLNQLNSIANS